MVRDYSSFDQIDLGKIEFQQPVKVCPMFDVALYMLINA
jgi:hypothetical protein